MHCVALLVNLTLGLWIKEIETSQTHGAEQNMINIPVAEELTDEEDSLELEVLADQRSAGKFRFKKSDMKSLLIGKTNQISMVVKKASSLSMSISWLKNCFSFKPSMSKKNNAILNY